MHRLWADDDQRRLSSLRQARTEAAARVRFWAKGPNFEFKVADFENASQLQLHNRLYGVSPRCVVRKHFEIRPDQSTSPEAWRRVVNPT